MQETLILADTREIDEEAAECQAAIKRRKVGDTVRLAPHPVDRYSVVVESLEGEKLGHLDPDAAKRIRGRIDQNPKKAETATITRQLDNAGLANLEMRTDRKTLPYAVLAAVAVFILIVLLLLIL